MPAKQMLAEYFELEKSIEGHADFYMDISGDGDSAYIHNITSYKRGEGIASKCMELITRLADKYAITLALEAGPTYNLEGTGDPLDGQDLVAWYSRLGFVWSDCPEMERKPK